MIFLKKFSDLSFSNVAENSGGLLKEKNYQNRNFNKIYFREDDDNYITSEDKQIIANIIYDTCKSNITGNTASLVREIYQNLINDTFMKCYFFGVSLNSEKENKLIELIKPYRINGVGLENVVENILKILL